MLKIEQQVYNRSSVAYMQRRELLHSPNTFRITQYFAILSVCRSECADVDFFKHFADESLVETLFWY